LREAITAWASGLRRDPLALRWATRRKEQAELTHWMVRAHEEGELRNSWYEGVFTEVFGLTRDDYAGKRVLDVGCGPRGSLEWATMAAERVGLDPLAKSYLRMGADGHAMTYVEGRIEDPPFPPDSFDIVVSINSLDHVDDIAAAARELATVLAPGGLLLINTELNHAPTPSEPQSFSWEVLDLFPPSLEILERRELEAAGGVAKSARQNIAFDHGNPEERNGVLVAKLRKKEG
jgi:SAM-dependent methyltransferase